MTTPTAAFYALAPGIDAVPLSDGHLLFRSDTLTIRIEGGFARVLAERLLPLLDGQHELEQLAAQVPQATPAELRERLDALVDAQVLRRAAQSGPQPNADQVLEPFLTLLETFGISAAVASATLSQLRVAIIGLEAHGAHLAAILARSGVGRLVLVDPYPCQPGNLALMPLVGPEALGVPRQQALKARLVAQGCTGELLTPLEQPLTREAIAEIAPGLHLLVGCFDKGFVATSHWLNRAGLSAGIPTLYAESRGPLAYAGPLVLPGQSACFMCYRMRSIACEEDFDVAMSYEEFLDRQKQPLLHTRGVLPSVPPLLGSMLAMEIFKYALSLSQLTLVESLLEFHALSFQTTTHSILRQPDCPVCGEKKKQQRSLPLIAELRSMTEPRGDLLAAAPRLVSRRTGIVRSLQLIKPDTGEPPRPFVLAAEIANHRFIAHEPKEQRACSGKGLTIEAARISALGEAVERYSGARWEPESIVYGPRAQIDGPTLDPRALVLYTADQYRHLPYQPYTGENVLGWTAARSLVSGELLYVPALAVYLSYDMRAPGEYLCPITSNGLAAGATLLEAILAATSEILERDAFMIAWLNRLPCQCVATDQHPDADVRRMCEAYRRRQVEVCLFRLPTDHPCQVFAAIAVQRDARDAPAAVVGLGADLSARRAARKAILEIGQVRPALRQRMRQPETHQRMLDLVADPHRVERLEDHDLLYASPAMLPALDFLLCRPSEPFDWNDRAPASTADQLELLVDHCRERGWDLIYANLTPPDMQALGLYTVRAIMPDFQPIHFGWKEPRLAGERLYELPRRLGCAAARTTPAQLNDAPHPLA